MDENRGSPPKHAADRQQRGADMPERETLASLHVVNPHKMISLLTVRNLSLLALIDRAKPASLTELSHLSGRPKASLTRTIRRFTDLGIVAFRKAPGKGKAPVLACRSVRIDVPLDVAPVAISGQKKD